MFRNIARIQDCKHTSTAGLSVIDITRAPQSTSHTAQIGDGVIGGQVYGHVFSYSDNFSSYKFSVFFSAFKLILVIISLGLKY